MKRPIIQAAGRRRAAAALWCTGIVPAAALGATDAAAMGTEPLSAGSLLQVTLGLAAVVITIFALAWFVRRYGRLQSGAGGALRVVGGLSVGPREKVVLVQLHDRQLVLGVAPGRVQTLHVLEGVRAPQQDAVPAAQGGLSAFAALLRRER